MFLIPFLFLFQIPPPEFRPGQKIPDGPDIAAYNAAQFLQKAIAAEQKSTNSNSLFHASNLRFISLYNLSSTGTRQKFNSKTKEVEKYSPLDDMVKVLIFSINQTNRVNPPVTLTKVKDDLFAIYYDSPGWTTQAWDQLASKDSYFRREWINDQSWNYLTAYTYTQYPIMRADQFVSLSTVAPDYYSLLGLPDTVQAFFALLGVNEKLLADSYRIKAGIKTDGLTVTINNRILERRQGPFDVWSSNDVVNSKGKKNALRQLDVIGGDVHKLDIDGQEHIFELGNGLWGGFLSNAGGKRVDEVPIAIARDDNFRDYRVIVGRSCFTCHDQGIKPFSSDQATLLEKNIVQLRTIKPEDSIALAGRYDEKSVQRLIKTDQENFRSAVEDLVSESPEKIAFMYSNAWREYNEKRVILHQAALECGLSDDGLIATIVPSIDPNLLKYLELDENKQSRTLARDVWEDVFSQVMLLKGKPAFPKDGVPFPTIDVSKLQKKEKSLEQIEDFSIIGSIILKTPAAAGEQQNAQVTLKTKNISTIKSYLKIDGIFMRSAQEPSLEHLLDFTFTASQAGFPKQVKIDLDNGRSIEIPIRVE